MLFRVQIDKPSLKLTKNRRGPESFSSAESWKGEAEVNLGFAWFSGKANLVTAAVHSPELNHKGL